MQKNTYLTIFFCLSMGLSSKAYGFDYSNCPGNNTSSCPSITGNQLQSCGYCCFDSSTNIMYCGCTMIGYEDPIKCQNSQLDIYKCDTSQPIGITLDGYLACTYSSEYGGGLYTASETHEYGKQNCPSIPEICGGPSLKKSQPYVDDKGTKGTVK